MIKCEICNVFFKSIVGHIRIHNISIADYKKIFPNSNLISEEQKKEISEKTKIAMHRPEVRKKVEEYYKNNDYSNVKPKYDRNDQNIKKKQYNLDRNKKISKARKHYWDSRRGKTVEELYGEEKGQKIRKLKSEQTKGDKNPSYGKVYYNNGRIRGFYKGFLFRSLWEYSFLKHLEKNGYLLEEIEYEKISIPYEINGIKRTYRPDFYIKKDKLLIEIKSKWHLKNNINVINLKKIAAEKWCIDNDSLYHIYTEDDFLILKMSELKNDINVIMEKINA